MFGSYAHDVEPTPEQETPQMDAPIEMDGFHTFGDSLGNMDLSFPNVEDRNAGQDWGELTNLMGGDEAKPAPPVETAEVSVAPAFEEAVEEMQPGASFPTDEASVRDIAQQAEGQVAVPPVEPSVDGAESPVAEIPTEEISEQPVVPNTPPVEVLQASSAPIPEALGESEPPVFAQHISSDSLFSDTTTFEATQQAGEAEDQDTPNSPMVEISPPAESPAVDVAEGTAFGNLLGDMSSPVGTKEPATTTDLPDVPADVPSEVTAQPAHETDVEAPAEAVTDIEDEVPVVDGI